MRTFDEYQEAARRTQPKDNYTREDKLYHAVFGLASEAGEVSGILQKVYQGHQVDEMHMARELGDCLWMISEACDALGISMSTVASLNIYKLRARYPDGFDAEHSLHRADGDV